MLIFALLLAVACGIPDAAHAMGKMRPGEGASSFSLNRLFRGSPKYRSGFGRRTFIIFVNGDADHFVTESSESGSEDAKLARVDAADVRKIDQLARSCNDCNVVLLHDQRGKDHWYTKAKHWAAFLRVYTVGHLVFERSVPELNGADPALITRLLQYSSGAFPGSELYFVYRGHAFIPDYHPTNRDSAIAPHDYSHPETPYGASRFVESLRQAQLESPLQAVVMAACSMADVELADALAPYAHTLISPQLDVLETLSAGFGYRYLTELDAVPSQAAASETIAALLLEPLQKTPYADDALLEYPVSLIRLSTFGSMGEKISSLLNEAELDPQTAGSDARVAKSLSARTIDTYRRKGKTEAQIHSLIRGTRQWSPHPDFMDVKRLLTQIIEQAEVRGNEPLKSRAQELMDTLGPEVRVWDRPDHSIANGLTYRWKASK